VPINAHVVWSISRFTLYRQGLNRASARQVPRFRANNRLSGNCDSRGCEQRQRQPQIPRLSHPNDEDLSLGALVARDDNRLRGCFKKKCPKTQRRSLLAAPLELPPVRGLLVGVGCARFFFESSLCRCQPRREQTEGRAGDVVEAVPVAELDGLGIATMFAADADPTALRAAQWTRRR